jgi:RimJ/RimL family protein N-acetyltransferase
VIHLVPATEAVARAVLGLEGFGDLARVPDWPHDDSADALRPLADHPEHTGAGTFLIVLDGQVVGDCGWFGPPDAYGEVEIGYGVAPSVRRRGVGLQAVTQLLEWVEAQGATRVRAEVLPGNEPSLRLLTRLGFHAVDRDKGHVVLVR